MAVRRALVETYADMPVEELCWGIPADFRQHPSLTLVDILDIASATQRMMLRVRRTTQHDPLELHGTPWDPSVQAPH